MKIEKQTVVGDVVTENYQTAQVFGEASIDFCCQGNRTLGEACETAGISFEKVKEELEKVNTTFSSDPDYTTWSMSFMVDYILNTHHRYIRKHGPLILEYLDKIVKVHGAAHPELLKVQELFTQSIQDLFNHLDKEEQILFPMIKEIEEAEKKQISLAANHCGTVRNPIQVMLMEHDNEGQRFREISRLTQNYTVPADGCNTYKAAMHSLRAFEEDLHKHIHLENNILYKKAPLTEDSLT